MAKRVAKVRVRDRDRGWRKLRGQVLRSAGLDQHVTIGVHGEDDARDEGGFGNVAVMAVHEFGSVAANIPERSVIRHTIDTNESKYRALVKALGRQVYITRITTAQALELLGAKVAADMRRTIDKTPAAWEALKASTLAARHFGGTKPLLDRGELKKSIKHKVFA